MISLLTNFVAAEPLHLVVHGQRYSDGARVYNCLAYQDCGDMVLTLGAESRAHIYLNRSLDEVQAQLLKCDLSALNGTIKAEGSSTALTVGLGGASLDLSPALLGTIPEKKRKAQEKKIDALIQSNKSIEAAEAIVKDYRLDRFKYQRIYDPTYTSGSYAVTDHEKMTITLPDTYRNLCNLLGYIRHEYEHAMQMEMAEACVIKGLQHPFTEHNERERLAYLGDVAAAEIYCPENANVQELGAILMIQDKYKREAPRTETPPASNSSADQKN